MLAHVQELLAVHDCEVKQVLHTNELLSLASFFNGEGCYVLDKRPDTTPLLDLLYVMAE